MPDVPRDAAARGRRGGGRARCSSRSCTGSSRGSAAGPALLTELARTAHRPFQVAVTVLAVQQAVRSTAGDVPGAVRRRAARPGAAA